MQTWMISLAKIVSPKGKKRVTAHVCKTWKDTKNTNAKLRETNCVVPVAGITCRVTHTHILFNTHAEAYTVWIGH